MARQFGGMISIPSELPTTIEKRLNYQSSSRSTKMYKTLCFILLLSLPSQSRAAEDLDSANFWQPKCKSLLNQNSPQDTVSGACMGIALMLKTAGRSLEPPMRVCIPADATLLQIIRVITKAIDEHPELMHEPFIALAIKASQISWPCQE
jgi:hypothetical protein